MLISSRLVPSLKRQCVATQPRRCLRSANMKVNIATSAKVLCVGRPTISVEIIPLSGGKQMNEMLPPMVWGNFIKQFTAHN